MGRNAARISGIKTGRPLKVCLFLFLTQWSFKENYGPCSEPQIKAAFADSHVNALISGPQQN